MAEAPEEGVPEPGSVDIVAPDAAAEVLHDVAHEAAFDGLMIALDIDGTVILEDESLSPGVVDAVRDAARSGHEVMIATGRSWESTRGIVRVLGIAPEYVVCSNGAVILRLVDADETRYERVHTEHFDPREVLIRLREHLPDARYMVELPNGDRRYTEAIVDWNLVGARQVPFDELWAEPVARIVVVSPDHREQDFVDLVEEIGLGGVSYAIGWTAWLDIAPKGVDKSSALEIVRTRLGVRPDSVLVIGDGRNDVGMFRWALEHGGRAIAMAQGPDEVREAAGEITASVHEGGVAAVLRAL